MTDDERERAQPRRPAAAGLRPHARSAADADRRPLQAARTRPDGQRDGDRPARPAAQRGRAARCRPARALRDTRSPVLRAAQHAAATTTRRGARRPSSASSSWCSAFGGQGAGGLYSERPDRSMHVLGVELGHDRGLALVYGAALAGWSYLVSWGALRALDVARPRAIGGILGVVRRARRRRQRSCASPCATASRPRLRRGGRARA